MASIEKNGYMRQNAGPNHIKLEGFINFVYFAQPTGEKNMVFFSNENRFAKGKTKLYRENNGTSSAMQGNR